MPETGAVIRESSQTVQRGGLTLRRAYCRHELLQRLLTTAALSTTAIAAENVFEQSE